MAFNQKNNFLRYGYTLLFYMVSPAIVARLYWRSRTLPAYRQRWAERFGYFKTPSLQKTIWVHAVSVGEVIAAVPLIKALRMRYPTHPLVVTTMTPTGSDRVKAAFGDSVFHVYIPYDFLGAVQRFLTRVDPCIAIIMETELWPNLFAECAKRMIPLCIANARLSPRSAKRYHWVSRLTHQTLNNVRFILAQTSEDANRFVSLGMEPSRIKVTGNIKFDITIPTDLKKQAASLRQSWGDERPVWIAASTHAGEEEEILAAFQKIRTVLPHVLLLLVPRHPDRFTFVATLCQQRGYTLAKRSELSAVPTGELSKCHSEIDIFLGDTMGELLLLYAAADIAFVGGSLVPTGGHNLLEPAALCLPVLTGPHLFNFKEVSHLLQQAKALFSVNNAEEIAITVLQLLRDPILSKQTGLRGRHVVETNRGALLKHLAYLDKLIQI